ncbi:MAG: GNAT family N-acetyltransferase [Halioglobus sp.]
MEKIIQNIDIQTISLPGDISGPLEKLFAEAERINPQFGLAWLNNLSSHALEASDEAFIIVASTTDGEIVALPLVRKRSGLITALSNFYTSSYQPLVSSTNSLPLFRAIFSHLAREERAAQLQLMPLNADSDTASIMSKAQREAGWSAVHGYFCFGNWVHDVNGQDYNEYIASRPSRLRNTIRRRSQKFIAGAAGELTLVTDATGLDEAINQFNIVYGNSWKLNEPYPDFIPSLIRLAAAKGWLRLGVATYKGIPVASQIWLVNNGTAYIYKLAYDENYKNQSPGTVLTAFMFEHVMSSDDVKKIDYLSGDDVYKKDWMSTRHERHGIAAYNPRSMRGFWQLFVHRFKQLLKRKSAAPLEKD